MPLALLASLVLASCGGEGEKSEDRSPCSEAAGTGPTVELRFRVDRKASGAGDSADLKSALCTRFESLGLDGVQLRSAGGGQLVARAPRDLESAVRAAAMPGRLHFYDWEPNVLGDRGPDQPFAGGDALFEAVKTASRARPRAEATDVRPGAPAGLSRAEADRRNDTSGDRYYLFGPDRRLISGPGGSPDLLAETAGRARPPGSRLLKVPRGIVVIEAERAPNQPRSVQRLFVLEDDSELSSSDIRNPKQGTDQRTREPIVTMEFTDEGRKAFAALTKRIAQRGAETILPPGTEREAALQRFAITLDRTVVSLATIDFRENPAGIDGRTGAQLNGIGSARRDSSAGSTVESRPLPGELVPLTARAGD